MAPAPDKHGNRRQNRRSAVEPVSARATAAQRDYDGGFPPRRDGWPQPTRPHVQPQRMQHTNPSQHTNRQALQARQPLLPAAAGLGTICPRRSSPRQSRLGAPKLLVTAKLLPRRLHQQEKKTFRGAGTAAPSKATNPTASPAEDSTQAAKASAHRHQKLHGNRKQRHTGSTSQAERVRRTLQTLVPSRFLRPACSQDNELDPPQRRPPALTRHATTTASASRAATPTSVQRTTTGPHRKTTTGQERRKREKAIRHNGNHCAKARNGGMAHAHWWKGGNGGQGDQRTGQWAQGSGRPTIVNTRRKTDVAKDEPASQQEARFDKSPGGREVAAGGGGRRQLEPIGTNPIACSCRDQLQEPQGCKPQRQQPLASTINLDPEASGGTAAPEQQNPKKCNRPTQRGATTKKRHKNYTTP